MSRDVSADVRVPVGGRSHRQRAMIDSRQLGRNVIILATGTISSRILTFIATAHVARVLGVDGFGAVVTALAILSYIELAVGAGFLRIGSREVVRRPGGVRRITRAVTGIRCGAALLATAVVGSIVWGAGDAGAVSRLVFVYSWALLPIAFDLSFVFIGIEKMWVIAAAEFASQAVAAVGVLALVRTSDDLLIVPLVYIVSKLVVAAFMVWIYVLDFDVAPWGVETERTRELARAAAPVALMAVVSNLNFNFDTIAVDRILGHGAAGVYGAAYRIVLLPGLLAVSYFTALRPRIDRAFATGFESLRSVLVRSLRLTLAASVGLAAAVTMFASEGIEAVFGDAYSAAANPLRILIWSFVLILPSRHYTHALVAFGRERLAFAAVALGAASNVALNLVAIPHFGLVGAASATLCSEVVILGVSRRVMLRHVGKVGLLRHLPGPLAAAALMSAAVLLSSTFALSVRILIGMVTYCGSIWIFRAVTAEDMRDLVIVFRRGSDRSREPQESPRGRPDDV